MPGDPGFDEARRVWNVGINRPGEVFARSVTIARRPHGLEVIGPCHIRRFEGGILAFGCAFGA